jgi:alpha-D-ribose 1-methylphosphonate 5-triphosphate synthase subunit PhnG
MEQSPHSSRDASVSARQSLMRLCAEATEAELQLALTLLEPLPHIQDSRAPSTGLVMLRGRTGGDGNAFNLGEATVTRAAVTLSSGATGFSYILGRSLAKARLAAIIDALGQTPDWSTRLQSAFIAPVSARIEAERATKRAETEATKVNFFTLVRGED